MSAVLTSLPTPRYHTHARKSIYTSLGWQCQLLLILGPYHWANLGKKKIKKKAEVHHPSPVSDRRIQLLFWCWSTSNPSKMLLLLINNKESRQHLSETLPLALVPSTGQLLLQSEFGAPARKRVSRRMPGICPSHVVVSATFLFQLSLH